MPRQGREMPSGRDVVDADIALVTARRDRLPVRANGDGEEPPQAAQRRTTRAGPDVREPDLAVPRAGRDSLPAVHEADGVDRRADIICLDRGGRVAGEIEDPERSIERARRQVGP